MDIVISCLCLLAALLMPVAFNRAQEARTKRKQRSAERDASTILRRGVGVESTSGRHAPFCLEVFGLDAAATPEEVVGAYRQLALDLHPDRGGDAEEFKRLQRNFELTMAFVERRTMLK